MILSIEEVKTHLRIQHDEEDTYIEDLIAKAQAAAEDYCRVTFPDDAPESVRLAVLLMTSHYYENRENLFINTGTYSFNVQQKTLAMQYDSGTSRICIVQTCTYDMIVYFDPKDFYSWTLIRE